MAGLLSSRLFRQVLDFLDLPVDSSYEQAAEVKPIHQDAQFLLPALATNARWTGRIVFHDVFFEYTFQVREWA